MKHLSWDWTHYMQMAFMKNENDKEDISIFI